MVVMREKPECLLHIGHSKTGSSSIQRAMASHRTVLMERGVYYPQTPGWANHALIPASVAPPSLRENGIHPAFWGGLSAVERIKHFRATFPEEIATSAASARLVVLSSEQCVFVLPDDASVRRLRALLQENFRRVRIVIYLRRQDEHFASAYTQRLRDGIIEHPVLPVGDDTVRAEYDYCALLQRWANVFGEDSVIVRLFDTNEFVGGDVIDDLLHLCNADGIVAPNDAVRQSNPSISVLGQALMALVGRDLAEQHNDRVARLSDPVWRRFTELMTELSPGRGWRPSASTARAFVDRFADGNEWIRSRWFPDRATLFSTDFDDAHDNFPNDAQLIAPAAQLLIAFAGRHLTDEITQLVTMAEVRAKHNDVDTSVALLRKAISIDETAPQPRLMLAAHLVVRGKRDVAVAHLNVAARRLPADDPELRRVQALVD